MSKITRFTQKIFGASAGVDQISKFGSLFAGAPAFTTDASQAQSLANFLTGWTAAAIGGNSPAIEDMNAAFFVAYTQLAYILQAGVPEWDSGTTYYIGSIANDGLGGLYRSIVDDNLNNALSDDTKWTKTVLPFSAVGQMQYGLATGDAANLTGNSSVIKKYLTMTGTGLDPQAPVWSPPVPPAITKYVTGSGNYTVPTTASWLRVRMVGGGGGGGGSGVGGASGGSNGGDSTFGTLTAGGGVKGGNGTGGGLGGSFTVGAGATDVASSSGGRGSGSFNNPSGSTIQLGGGHGAASFFGSGGSSAYNVSGSNGIAYGSGGGGGGTTNTLNASTGSGGGSGAYVEAIIPAPTPGGTIAYSVGATGSGESAGTSGNAGGNGAIGMITIEAY